MYATWKIAEAAYESLSNLYDFTERGKINIALADYDDYSNGSTDWTNESIIIWIIDARFDLRGDNTWLRNVITHELSHIVTLEKSSGMQLPDWTFDIDYQSPHASVSHPEPLASPGFGPNGSRRALLSGNRSAPATMRGTAAATWRCATP